MTVFELGASQFGKDIGPDVVRSWDVFDVDMFKGGLNDYIDQMVIL